MRAIHEIVICRYLYDPLDRLVKYEIATKPCVERFYQEGRLVSEIEGQVQRSILQQQNLLLAQQRCQNTTLETTLLATDQQRSVLHALDVHQSHSVAYTPYGYRRADRSCGLLGFNGEQPDSMIGHYLLGNGYRVFNPVLMRFNSPDSWSPFGAGGLNAYGYCSGDPVNRSDPTGHSPLLKAFMMFRESKLTPSGDFQRFAGAPHVLEKIAGSLFGRDRVNFSKASTFTRSLTEQVADPLGDLTRLKGRPLEEIAKFLPGKDLTSFSLASKETQRTARAIQHPIWRNRDEGLLTNSDLNNLRKTALGEKPGHFPSEVLQDEFLLGVSKIRLYGGNPELDSLRYQEKLIRNRMDYKKAFHRRERRRLGL